MKIGIISDIHSNLEALQKVVEVLKQEDCSEIIFLGDAVGYGANPNECIELLQKLRLVGVAGNHDYAVLNKTPIHSFNDYAQAAILWTQKVLKKEALFFLDSLLLTQHSYPFHIVHSSPDEPEEWFYLFLIDDVAYQFNYFSAPVCLIGHTHIPLVVCKKKHGEIVLVKEESFELNSSDRYIINVGSVGQPRDTNPKASFGIYDTKRNLFEIRRVSYDIDLAGKKIIEAKLPPFLAERLYQGR